MLISVKLSTGEELIAEYVSSDEETLTLRHPVSMYLHVSGGIEARHYLNFTDCDVCVLDKYFVVMISENVSAATQKNYNYFIANYKTSMPAASNEVSDMTEEQEILLAMEELRDSTIH